MTDETTIKQTTVKTIKGDLTDLDVDAIVFYAKSDLALGSGYGNAIATRGGPSIKAELNKIGSAEQGQSVITEAGMLKTKHIIHAVGPAFQEMDSDRKLRETMDNSLKCASENGIGQIAYPIMGIGFYGIAPDKSIKIMLDSINDFISKNNSPLKEIIICANDNREYKMLDGKLANINQGDNNE